MKYWFDTEFIEDGVTIDLLSIGIVAEDGRESYWKNKNAKFANANEWVQANVFPSLGVVRLAAGVWVPQLDSHWISRPEIAHHLLSFVGTDSKPELWGYFADYDWVVLCQLFGRMIDLPKGWPMYCRDVKQLCDSLGNPKLPMQDAREAHHALNDARWTKMAYEYLIEGQHVVTK